MRKLPGVAFDRGAGGGILNLLIIHYFSMRLTTFLLTAILGAAFAVPVFAKDRTLVGTYWERGNIQHAGVDGTYLYVPNSAVTYDHKKATTLNPDLQIVDVSNPKKPRQVANLEFPNGAPYNVVASGDYVYVANKAEGFQVVDVSDKESPALVTTLTYQGYRDTGDIALSGSYAYATLHGLTVIDVSSPREPSVVGTYYEAPNAYSGIAVSGDFVFAGGWTRGVTVFDVSNPAAPIVAATLDTNGETKDVAVANGYLYVADGSAGLKIVDVADPTNPVLRASYKTLGYAYGITVVGSTVYLADGADVDIFDVADPTNPTLTGRYEPGLKNPFAFDIAVSGDYGYVSHGMDGVLVLDVSDTDREPPVITMLGDDPAVVTVGDTYIDAGATATDNIDGDLTSKIALASNVDTSRVGAYHVTYNVTDNAGNAAKEAKRTVIVQPKVKDPMKSEQGTALLKRSGKTKALSPFGGGYKGGLFSKRVQFDAITVRYVFLPTDAFSSATLKLYNDAGALVAKRKLLNGTAKSGINAAAGNVRGTMFVAVGSRVRGTAAEIYAVRKNGLSVAQTLTLPLGYYGNVLIGFVENVQGEPRLITMVKDLPSSARAWKYSAVKRKFVSDATFDTTTVHVVNNVLAVD